MKHLILLVLGAFYSMMAHAQIYDKEIDGVCYKIIGDEAMVTVHDEDEERNTHYYSGTITIPESITYKNKRYPVTKIGPKSFMLCHEVNEIFIPNSVTTIADKAFCMNAGITNIHIGSNVKEIGLDAFSQIGLSNLDLDPANKYFVLEGGVFYSADHKRAITLVSPRGTSVQPDLHLHDDVETIDNGFATGRRLNTIHFGNKIKSIGDEAFRYAFSESLNQPDLILPDGIEHIGWGAFADCIRIDNLHLPDSLTRLEPFSFSYVSPEFIHMPKNLKVICDNALDCNAGGVFRNIVLPEGLDSLGEFAITCISADSLIIPSTVRYLSQNCLSNYSRYIEIKAPLDSITSCAMPSQCVRELILPKTLKKICNGAFYPCYDLKKIVWPDALEEIGDLALAGNKINPMVVPSTIKKLGDEAFSDNVWQAHTYYFTSATPPTCQGSNVFYYNDLNASTLYVPQGCKDTYASQLPFSWFGKIEEYTEIVIPATPTRYDFESNGLYYNILSEKDKTCEVSYDLNFITDKNTYKYKDVIVPETIDYDGKTYTVTGIEGNSFFETPLEHITLPKTIINLDGAFSNCYNLESIELPENVTSIGGTFHSCSKLKTLHIPEKVENIASAFHDCTSLESVNIPANVNLVDGAFFNCKSLKTIVFPDHIKKIGRETCFGCSSLTSVKLPADLEEIGEIGFASCESLKSIVLPAHLHLIHIGAFECCPLLKNIISLNPEPPYGIGYNWFTSDDNNITVHVPTGSKSAYQNLDIWKYYNIIEDATTSIHHPSITTSKEKRYDILGRPVNESHKGLVIKDGKLYAN